MRTRWLAVATMLPIVLPSPRAQGEGEPETGPEIRAEIERAAAEAKAKNKRVLVVFLGDGELSRGLDAALRENRKLSRQLLYEFVVVRAEADEAGPWEEEVDELGVPSMLALDGERHVVGKFNKHSFWSRQYGLEPDTLHGALELVHAPPLDAEEQLDAALQTCRETGRNLLLHFDAPW